MSQIRRGRKVTYTSIEERYQQVELSTQQTYRHRNHNVTDRYIGSTMVPNRIFIGGLTNGTSEQDLRNYFSAYGEVKVVKIVKDKAGALKGFGFITFGTEEEVKKIIDAGPVLMFRDKRINVAPAFEKDNRSNYDSNHSPQQQSHVMSYSSQVQQYSVPPLPTPAQPMLAPVMYTYQNGMAFFNMPVNGNNPVTPQPPGPQNSTSTESLVPSIYATAPYGTQSATNMQGYSGQPIFYPNPVPQVLVQQAYPNLPVSSVCNGNSPGSKVLFSMPCDTPYYSGTQMSSMIHNPDMAYPMPIMSPYMPYMVASSDGGYPYYDPVMENIQLVHQPLYTEQCTNPRPPSSDASVGQAQVITTNQFVSLMSVVRNDEEKPQMYTPEPQQLCLTPVISLAEPPPQSVSQPIVSKPTTSSPPANEKSDQSPNQLLMTQIQYNIRHPPPSINSRPELKDSIKQRGDSQQYQGNNNNLSIKNNNDYMKNSPKKYPETRTFYKTGPTINHPRHPNGPQHMVNSSFTSPFFVPNTNFRHRFPKMHYPAVPQVMINPNYSYPNQGNVRPSNGQHMFNNRVSRYGSNNYQSNKKNYSSYKGNRINRYTSDQGDNPEVSSTEDSRTEQLSSVGDVNSPQVEGVCSDMRSMTI